jgi:phosphoserine aminotransferase
MKRRRLVCHKRQSELINDPVHNGVLEAFVAKHDWASFLPEKKEIRSNTSVCLNVKLPEDKLKEMVKLLAKEGVAYDCASYREAPPGLRFWCGATVEASDVEIVTQWLAWAYEQFKG